jgi:hypothetical protein
MLRMNAKGEQRGGVRQAVDNTTAILFARQFSGGATVTSGRQNSRKGARSAGRNPTFRSLFVGPGRRLRRNRPPDAQERLQPGYVALITVFPFELLVAGRETPPARTVRSA